jgi:hypothetical protein
MTKNSNRRIDRVASGRTGDNRSARLAALICRRRDDPADDRAAAALDAPGPVKIKQGGISREIGQ